MWTSSKRVSHEEDPGHKDIGLPDKILGLEFKSNFI
jgi:hypothetical protein